MKRALHLPQQSIRHIQQNVPPLCLLETPDPSCSISAATYEPEQVVKIHLSSQTFALKYL